MGFFEKLKAGLSKTRAALAEGLNNIFKKFRRVDEDLMDELEELLITSDIGVETSMEILDTLRDKIKTDNIKDPDEVKAALFSILRDMIGDGEPIKTEAGRMTVILVIGVNGVGKTTSIAKIANVYKRDGKKVILAAADTFRAAAVEQLKVWGERTGCPVVSKPTGADAAGLVFDALTQARQNGDDVLFIDTAGRLQNRSGLMDELQKIIRIIKKQIPDAPHACLQVLDATVGQNAHSQVKIFSETIPVSGLILTKLDGTAKGGVLVALTEEFKLPVHLIGVGEHIDDLRPFKAQDYAGSLMGLAAKETL